MLIEGRREEALGLVVVLCELGLPTHPQEQALPPLVGRNELNK